ncbi:copper transporter 6 [Quercus suber]|uniref:Copper transporter 6 n=1 Tax=Quercus suber TaxID=58331 RepID=A0AAW0KMB0_QUESU
MDHDDMPGMGGMSPPPPSSSMNGTTGMHRKMIMHMTFFWGKNAEILFNGWPGTNTGMIFNKSAAVTGSDLPPMSC